MKPSLRKRKTDQTSAVNGNGGAHSDVGGSIQLVDDDSNSLDVDMATEYTRAKIPEDDKVINGIRKLGGGGGGGKSSAGISGADATSATHSLKIVVASSEGSFFEDPTFLVELKTKLNVHDILVSRAVEGSVDRFVTVFGDLDTVCRAAIFISFCLNAKLNNVARNNLFTLKSSNYSLTLLVDSFGDTRSKVYQQLKDAASHLVVYDHSPSYARSNTVGTVYVRGDIQALFGFLRTVVSVFAASKYVDDDKIVQHPVTGVYGNPGLFQRQSVNTGVLSASTQAVLSYIYPSE
ncbi:hypothetical protein CAAN3_03S07668 [[Candida] anglica]